MNTRRDRILVKKLKKRKRTRILRRMSVLVVLLSVTAYFGIKMYRQYDQSHKNIGAIMTPVGETSIADINGTKNDLEQPETDFPSEDSTAGFENISFSIAATVPKKIDFDKLLNGGSYSIRASSYAYDTDEVKAWMKGKIEYNGPKIAFLTFDDGPGKYTPSNS